MRLDEHGRWVSDDGAYIWDEAAQVWQPTTSPIPVAGPDQVGPPAGASTALDAWQDPAVASGVSPTTGWSQPAALPGPSPSASGPLPTASSQDPWGTGAWSVASAGGAAAAAADPFATGHPGAGYLDSGPWPAQGERAQNHPGQAVEPPAAPVSDAMSWGAGEWQAPGQAAAPAPEPADPLGTGAWALPPAPAPRAGSPGTGPIGTDPMGTGAWSVGGRQPGPDASPASAGPQGTGAWPVQDPYGGVGPGAQVVPWGNEVGAQGPAWVQPKAAGTRPADTQAGYAPTGAYSTLGAAADEEDFSHDAPFPSVTGPVPVREGARRRARRGDRRTAAPAAAAFDDAYGADGGGEDDDLDLYGDTPGQGRRTRLGRLGSSLGSLPKPALVGLALLAAVLLFVPAFLVLGGGDEEESAAAAAPPAAGAQPGRYDDEVRRVFLDECIRVSKGAEAYCTCTLEKLEAAYSQGEYLEFSDNVDDAESQRIIREISESCRAVG